MNRFFLVLLFLCLALPGYAQKRHGKLTLDVGIGLTAFAHSSGFSGSFSLMQQRPDGTGYFLEGHSYGEFVISPFYGTNSVRGSMIAIGRHKTWTQRALFTTVGAGLGQEQLYPNSSSTPSSNRIGIYARAGVGLESHSVRLSVSGFGLATTRQPVFGYVFGVGLRF